MAIDLFEGPIPGENYTSDTKNYPWHRPPEVTDMDKAIELIARKVMSEPLCFNIITMLEVGVPVISITGIILMQGIGAGKWTPDYAIMLAGPTCHIIMIMAESYGVKYTTGLDTNYKPKTKHYFEMANRVNAVRSVGDQMEREMNPEPPIAQPGPSGFMNVGKDMIETEGNSPEDNQTNMQEMVNG